MCGSIKPAIYFVKKNSTSAWYLPVDQMGGAAQEIALAGVFQHGGSLLFGATWSLDAGNGIDDKCVFVSDQGEMAVYEGAAPSEADWSLVGRYDISPPMGKNGTMQAGGDLLVLMEDGIVPISQALQRDRAALSMAAVSRAIEPDWRQQVIERRSLPWQIVKWPAKNMAIVSLPVINEATPPVCFVINLETGAWARYTGWDTRSLVNSANQVYFGTSTGTVMAAEMGGNDAGETYVSTCVYLFDILKSPGVTKILKLARATFLAARKFTPKVSASLNYAVTLPSPPSVYGGPQGASDWDVGLWDQATWGGAGDKPAVLRRVGMYGAGFSVAPQIQVANNAPGAPDAELVSFDLIYERGGVVV